MKLPRVRFTIRRIMAAVLLSSLVLALVVSIQQRDRRLAIARARAAYLNAQLTRQVAEIALVEYQEGIYKQDKGTLQGEIALAESDRKRAEDRLEWSRKMHARGFVSQAQFTSDKLSVDRAAFSTEQAKTKLDVLEKYTFNKTIKELQSEVEKARAAELARWADYVRVRWWPW
jgi:HlyD family secretion protein